MAALDRFSYPSARLRPSRGGSIPAIDNLLLSGVVKDADSAASKMDRGGHVRHYQI